MTLLESTRPEALLTEYYSSVMDKVDGVHVTDFPDKIMQNVRQRVAMSLADDETPLVFVDNTVFRSGKKGLLFTDRACHHRTNSKPGSFAYSDIESCAAEIEDGEAHLFVTLKDGSTQKLCFLSKTTLAPAAKFVNNFVDEGDKKAFVQVDDVTESPKHGTLATILGLGVATLTAGLAWGMIGRWWGFLVACVIFPIVKAVAAAIFDSIFGGKCDSSE